MALTKKTAKAKSSKSASKPKPEAKAKTTKSWSEMMKKAGADKTWNEKRKEKDSGGDFVNKNVEDGTYTARVEVCAASITGNGAFFRVSLLITRGECKGEKLTILVKVVNKEGERNEKGMDIIRRTLQRLGYDTSEMDIADLEEAAKDITKENPVVSISVKNSTGDNGMDFQNVYINKLVDDLGDEE